MGINKNKLLLLLVLRLLKRNLLILIRVLVLFEEFIINIFNIIYDLRDQYFKLKLYNGIRIFI